MQIVSAQLVSLSGLFASMVGAFLLPYWWASRRPDSLDGSRYRLALGLANCLSGGVFVATFFVGLMPEVRRTFLQVLATYETASALPVTEAVVSAGFLLALGVEQGVLEKRGGHCHDVGQLVQGESGLRLGMLLVSLGVHSLFEGLALGLQSDVATLFNLVVGVAAHELLVAVAMGVSVSRLRLPRPAALKLAALFAASIPVGQLVGLMIGHSSARSALAASGVLQGLAAGTFIHVTFLEIIPAEFNESGYRLLKVFFLGLGFMLLLLCTIFMRT